ncbi:MAG: F0F1 ATP synthase subunit A [Rhodobacteraceae bacterium]|nr:MAG: F0F1 ATP synthase subunit A [Paracoccaceae bacterium]
MASEGAGLEFHPMDQFIVKPLFGGDVIHWYTPTNATLWLFMAVLAVIGLMVLTTSRRAIVPTRGQSVAELTYGFIYKMVEDVTGKDAIKFFPYIFTLFLFILCANFLALIPMSFSTTSHLAVTAVMALGVFLTVIVVGFAKNGVGFLKLFWLTSAPPVMRPILAVLEFMLFFARPVSHSVRLFGAIMAGHAVVKVFAGFAQVTAAAPVAILGVVAIYGLEMLVAAIQAYVFTILTCVYLKDALHPHH